MYAAFHTVGLPNLSLNDVIDRVKGADYRGIELNAENLPWAKPHITPNATAACRQNINSSITEANLSVAALGAHIPMVSSDKADRKSSIEFVKGCIDLALDVGGRYVHILSGPLEQDIPTALGWKWFADSVSEVTQYSTNLGVVLGIEPIAGHLFHSNDCFLKLIKDLPGVPFKVNFDPSQIIIQGDDPTDLIENLGDHIAHVHIKDGSGLYPKFMFPPLGQGDVNFQDLVKRLRNIEYNGALSIEYEAQVFGFKLSDDDILHNSRKFLSDLGVS